jgi:hypothetical protein
MVGHHLRHPEIAPRLEEVFAADAAEALVGVAQVSRRQPAVAVAVDLKEGCPT